MINIRISITRNNTITIANVASSSVEILSKKLVGGDWVGVADIDGEDTVDIVDIVNIEIVLEEKNGKTEVVVEGVDLIVDEEIEVDKVVVVDEIEVRDEIAVVEDEVVVVNEVVVGDEVAEVDEVVEVDEIVVEYVVDKVIKEGRVVDGEEKDM